MDLKDFIAAGECPEEGETHLCSLLISVYKNKGEFVKMTEQGLMSCTRIRINALNKDAEPTDPMDLSLSQVVTLQGAAKSAHDLLDKISDNQSVVYKEMQAQGLKFKSEEL